MKSKLSFLLPLSVAASLSSNAAVITLMDYDDGLANGVHGSNLQSGDVGVQDWNGNHQYQTNNNSGVGSNQNLILGSNRVTAHTLGYSANLGDTFAATYMWRAAFNWDTADRIIFSLFYTNDDTITGTRTNFFSEESAAHTATYSVETVTSHTVSDAAAVGKNIFIEFSDNASAGANEFARLDNVFVSVDSVPEPSSTFLLGLGGVALLLRRKK